METQPLQVEIRKDAGSIKSRKNRKSGLIPAILYGHKQENLMFSLKEKDFSKILDSKVKMVNLKWNS